MIYQSDMTIPPQTPFDKRLRSEFTLPAGVIQRLAILFPPGCAGLVHLRILHNEHQIWPSTPEKSFIGDSMYAVFDESYHLPDAWNQIRVEGWNLDDSYEHHIWVWIAVLPQTETWTYESGSEELAQQLGVE